MAQSALRRIVQPGVKLAVLTKAFTQVGWSVLGQFELIVLPGPAQPIETGAAKKGSLTARMKSAVLTSGFQTAASQRQPGTALTQRGVTALSSKEK